MTTSVGSTVSSRICPEAGGARSRRRSPSTSNRRRRKARQVTRPRPSTCWIAWENLRTSRQRPMPASASPRRRGGVLEVTALVLLLVGGLLFGIGWLVGLVLLWSSPVWSTGQKLLGTFVVPGGLATPFFFFLVGAAGEGSRTCTGPVGSGAETVCTGGTSTAAQAGWTFLFALLVVGNIAAVVYLAQRLRGRTTLAAAA